MHQELVLARAGQRFVLDPPGRPSGPASVVVESSHGVVQKATAGTCEIDPVETALTEVAPIAATSLPLASTANITPGSRYQLVDPDGVREWIVVTTVTESRVALRRPLVNRFAAASIVGGCRISIAADDAWTANIANLTDHLDVNAGYRLRWTYAIDGVVTSSESTADLVRVPQQLRLTPADVENRFPGWIANLPPAYRASAGSELITEALELVNRDVLDHPEIRRARDAAMLRELALIRANFVELEHAALFQHAPTAALAEAEQRYRQQFAKLLADARTPTTKRAPLEPIAPVEAPYSVSHASTIDALLTWVVSNPLNMGHSLRVFTEVWIPRLRTPDERVVAAKLIRSSVTSTKRKIVRWRDEILRKLES